MVVHLRVGEVAALLAQLDEVIEPRTPRLGIFGPQLRPREQRPLGVAVPVFRGPAGAAPGEPRQLPFLELRLERLGPGKLFFLAGAFLGGLLLPASTRARRLLLLAQALLLFRPLPNDAFLFLLPGQTLALAFAHQPRILLFLLHPGAGLFLCGKLFRSGFLANRALPLLQAARTLPFPGARGQDFLREGGAGPCLGRRCLGPRP